MDDSELTRNLSIESIEKDIHLQLAGYIKHNQPLVCVVSERVINLLFIHNDQIK